MFTVRTVIDGVTTTIVETHDKNKVADLLTDGAVEWSKTEGHQVQLDKPVFGSAAFGMRLYRDNVEVGSIIATRHVPAQVVH